MQCRYQLGSSQRRRAEGTLGQIGLLGAKRRGFDGCAGFLFGRGGVEGPAGAGGEDGVGGEIVGEGGGGGAPEGA